MKKLALPILALLLNMICCSAFSQEVKPKKTFDHQVFAKRFHNYYSTNFSTVKDFLATDKDLEYISSKTGKPLQELKDERDEMAVRLPNELAHLAEKGTQGQLLQKVELEIIQESPIKVANIILFIAAKGVVEEILFNCVQTNETWVLGDFIGFRGEKPVKQALVKEPTPEEKLTRVLENKNFDVKKIAGVRWDTYEIYKKDNSTVTYFAGAQIDKNNLKNVYLEFTNDNTVTGVISQNGNTVKKLAGKWKYDEPNKQIKVTTKDETITYGVCNNTDKELVLKESGQDIYYVLWNTNAKYEAPAEPAPTASSSNIKVKTTKPYHANTKPMQGTDGASPYVDRSLIDKPVRGYYIDLNGNKVDAVIKYQSPELMTANTSALLIYNKAFNEPGFAEDESNNFKAVLMKDQVLLFVVGGQVYIPVKARNKKEWAILLHEGAIKEFVLITKEKVNGVESDLVVNFYEKQGGLYQSGVDLILGFKGKMGALVSDNSEMVTKINNKEDGYKLLNAGNIIKEYNEWFDTQYPAKANYLFYEDGSPVIKK